MRYYRTELEKIAYEIPVAVSNFGCWCPAPEAKSNWQSNSSNGIAWNSKKYVGNEHACCVVPRFTALFVGAPMSPMTY